MFVTVVMPKWELLSRENRFALSSPYDPESEALAAQVAARALLEGKANILIVRAKDAAEAFNALNSDDRPNGRHMRSMSVGDVVVHGNGEIEQCMPAGWRDVSIAFAGIDVAWDVGPMSPTRE